MCENFAGVASGRYARRGNVPRHSREGCDLHMTYADTAAPEATADEQDGRKGAERIVLRGRSALVLDELSAATRRAVLDAASPAEPRLMWEPVARRTGTVEAAIKSFSGPSGRPDHAGTFRAVPASNWYVAPLVIEPPLA